MTKSERGRYNRALKELRDAGATPDEITKRARHYAQTYPGASLTPTALATHWSSLKVQSRYPQVETAQQFVDRLPDDPPLPCREHGQVRCVPCAERARNAFLNQLHELRVGEMPDAEA